MKDQYWQAVYLLCVFLLLPSAIAIRLQISVLIMLWIFLTVGRTLAVPPHACSPP